MHQRDTVGGMLTLTSSLGSDHPAPHHRTIRCANAVGHAIKASKQGPWIYRMDCAWADTAVRFGRRTPVGRIGHMGAYRNPDVARR